MFKSERTRVVIGSTIGSRTFDTLLLPGGEHAILVDRDVHERALHAADELFEQTVRQMKVHREQRGRASAAW
jgi:hypothetical protein